MILYFYEDELDKTLQQWHLSYSFYTIQRKQVGDSALKGDALRLTTWIESSQSRCFIESNEIHNLICTSVLGHGLL